MEETEEESLSDILRDRFRLASISIIQSQANRDGMEIYEPIVACISDLAFKYTQNLAKDLELFSHHAGRKTVNINDVLLAAHRNEQLAVSLRSFADDLKTKEPQFDRKRKKVAWRKEDNNRGSSSAVHILDT